MLTERDFGQSTSFTSRSVSLASPFSAMSRSTLLVAGSLPHRHPTNRALPSKRWSCQIVRPAGPTLCPTFRSRRGPRSGGLLSIACWRREERGPGLLSGPPPQWLGSHSCSCFLTSRSWAVAQATQRGRSLRPVAFDCFGRLPLSLQSGAQARRGLQDRRSRRGSLVERHRRENEIGAAWPSTSQRGRRGSARRTSRWSPS